MRLIFSLWLSSLVTFSYAQHRHNVHLRETTCTLEVDAGEDVVLCNGEPGQLSGSASGDITNIEWTPSTGLSDPTVLDPTVDVSTMTVYTLTVMGIGGNVIENGDFENGNISPASSSLTHYDPNTFYAGPAGTYTVTSVFQVTGVPNICDPHGGDNMMVIHGGSPNMWCQTVSVEPQTDYKFSGWFMGADFLGIINTTDVEVKINGQSIGGTGANGICTWNQVSGVWNSGTSSTATICIDGIGDNGSWTAIDDLELIECCVVKDQVKVFVEKVEAEIPFGGILTCLKPTLKLDGKRLSRGPIVSYEWDTPDGEIVEGANDPVVTISKKGIYNLTVTGKLGCTDEASILVEGNTEPPPLDVNATNLTCLSDSARIISMSMGEDLVYSWTGPDSFRSNRAIDTVQIGGKYYIHVKDKFFCENEDSVVVLDFRTLKSYDLLIDSFRCGKDSAFISLLNDTIITSYLWLTGGSTIPDTNQIAVGDTGIVYGYFKDKYGCEWGDTLHLSADLSVPNLFIHEDSITCNHPEANLIARSDSAITTFLWRYPDGTISYQPDVLTTLSGWHFITITPEHGCPVTDSVFVKQIGEIPTLSIRGDTLDCNHPTVTLTGMSNNSTISASWSGPGIIRTNGLQATVNHAGIYTLTIQTPEGCSRELSYEVVADSIPPDVAISGDSAVNCISPSVRLKPLVPQVASFRWKVPPAALFDGDTVVTDIQGWHYLIAEGKNGCVAEDSIFINVDTMRPPFILEKMDFTCRNGVGSIRVQPSRKGNYFWKLPGTNTFQSGDTLFSAYEEGWYQFKEIYDNGCARLDSVFIEIDTLAPLFTVSDDTLNCGDKSLRLKLLIQSAYDSVKWTGPDGFYSEETQPVVHKGGDYRATITGKNGCTSEVFIHIEQTGDIPDLAITGRDTIDCNHTEVTLSSLSSFTTLSYNWRFPDGSSQAGASITAKDSGWYLLTVQTPEGCSNSARYYVAADLDPPSLDWSVDTLTCAHAEELIRPVGPIIGLSFAWQGPDNYQDDHPKPQNIREQGLYVVRYKGKNGCEQMDSLWVPEDRTPPDLHVVDDTLDCINGTAILKFQSSKTNLNLQWLNSDGTLLSKSPTLIVRDSGVYSIHIEDENNHCTSEAKIKVFPPNEIEAIDVEQSQDCRSAKVSLEITEVRGGTPPYQYALDGGPLQSQNKWQTKSGNRTLMVVDAKGCSYEEQVLIDSLERLVADLTGQLELFFGEKSQVRVTTNRQPGDILSYQWSPTEGLSCTDCADPYVSPNTDINYTVIIEDIYGCTDTLSLRVVVKFSDKVYIPNSFVPSSGGINSRFKIFLPEGTDAEILSMKIFDRWGEQVYYASGIKVSESQGWDGIHKGKLLNPGVFVYYIRLRLASGTEIALSGDVTLLR